MEFYQSCQNRANQTIAVINLHVPGMVVGGVNTAAMSSLCTNLDGLAQTRDNKVADEDTARNAENLAYLALRSLTLALPRAAEGELDEDKEDEEKLAGHLDEVFSLTPRTTELAIQRGRKLVAALTKINAFLTTRVPPRLAITSGGKGISHLQTALDAMPGLEQVLEDKAAGARDGRTDLRNGARAVDRLNKRFYKKLQAEARTNPDLAAALSQIDTDSDNLPETLSIQTLLQAGPDLLHVQVTYQAGTGSEATERHLDWMVPGVDADFTNTTPADLSGNLIGPFTAGQIVLVRTRTLNANGTRTSATRRLTIHAV